MVDIVKQNIKKNFLPFNDLFSCKKYNLEVLFHVHETTNVFLHNLSRFFTDKNLFPQRVDKIGLHVYISLRTGVTFLGKKISANQNAHATFFHV